MIVTVNGIKVHTPECPKCGQDTAVLIDESGFVYCCVKCGHMLTIEEVLNYGNKNGVQLRIPKVASCQTCRNRVRKNPDLIVCSIKHIDCSVRSDKAPCTYYDEGDF